MNYYKLLERFSKLHIYATNSPDTRFRFVDDTGASLTATFDTAYETDNGLEPGEEGYEEFDAMAFCEDTTGELFEVTYLSLPKEVWDGNKRII
ncbi:MAG: hypothetical protein PUB39_06735 [Eubacteriales bacterium]|nr:hypothetical protein [Eubacteriales bacterium]